MRVSSADVTSVEVVLHGELPGNVADYARARVSELAEHLDEPVLHVRIRLTHRPDPSVGRPVRAQANLDVNGRLVRAQVAGADAFEAVNLLVARLGDRLARLKQHWRARGTVQAMTEADGWHHGGEPTHRPPYYPRPAEDRLLIAHKSFSPSRVSPNEAAWEMDQMDYDFHLFTEAATGRDAVVYRGGPTGYRLARLVSGAAEPQPSGVPITLSPHPAPELTVAQARQRLEETGLPFVFFAGETGRGNVLYHRYDGHYGLITPAG